MKKLRFLLQVSALLLVSVMTFAKSGVSVDADGNTLPSPVGNIPFFKMPNALAADNNEYTWDYNGTLKSGDQLFSLEASMAQIGRTGSIGLGFHIFDFAFQNDGAWFYSNSTYGGDNVEPQAMMQSLDWIQSSASLQHFSVTESLLANPALKWSVTSLDSVPQGALYKGFVGQPGHEYRMTGAGQTYLWRYDIKTGVATVVPYTYTLSIDMLDERGATMEGVSSGYVGPSLNPLPDSIGATYKVESEIAQPRLRVLDWHITLQSVNPIAASGYRSSYDFSGSEGMMWNDFGPLKIASRSPSAVHANSALTALIQKALPNNVKETLNLSPQQMANLGAAEGDSSLYNGSWIPVDFTEGKYKGLAIAFSTIWNKTEKYPANQTTDDTSWSTFSWCNFFSGLIPDRLESTFSMLETLYPENPGVPNPGATQNLPPYEIKINRFVPTAYTMAFPWAQNVTITIRANTALRYAMAIYADELANNQTADDPTKDIVIHIQAVSPVTQNTLFSSGFTQYYEGAAVPTIDGQVVGYSWIEHMV